MLPVTIGNDIVDLRAKEAQDKHSNRRFLAKVCSLAEIEMIKSSINPHQMLWTLWAIKEASYKALMKRYDIKRFIPNQFLCEPAGEFWRCSHKGMLCESIVDLNEGYVHAIACSGGAGKIIRGVLEGVPEQQHSKIARDLAEKFLSDEGCNGGRVERFDGTSPPVIIQEGAPVKNWDVSLSHDGEFVAAALLGLKRNRNTDHLK